MKDEKNTEGVARQATDGCTAAPNGRPNPFKPQSPEWLLLEHANALESSAEGNESRARDFEGRARALIAAAHAERQVAAQHRVAAQHLYSSKG